MLKQKILIIGGGGREHAVGWKVAQSPRTGQIFFAPGNGGTVQIGTNVDIAATDLPKLLDFVKKEQIDLTIALPDDPIALGIVDLFKSQNLRIWGPTRQAAELEWSKSFSKNFMKQYKLPTARFEIFNDFEKAKKHLITQNFPVVIKASGLALGKGVIIAQTAQEATQALENMLVNKIFGESGSEVVIEEFLTGPEISIHAFSDGRSYSMFPPAQDHKKIGEGNTGLNTGGIGSIVPVPFVTDELIKSIGVSIVAPTIAHMEESGTPFQGILYPGLILTDDGPKILEYNARFGDPEVQTYMRLLETDLLDIADACIDGTLGNLDVKWKNLFACTIVLVSQGYPENYEKGKEISGIEEAEINKNIIVFHAGTKQNGGKLVTNGGRVLGVSAIGKDLKEALEAAYQAIKKISFEGMYYRRDIGKETLLISEK